MTTISVTATYTCSTDTMVDLPNGKTWEDVMDWHIKWGRLYIVFKDGTVFEHETDDISLDGLDTKRPSKVTIRACDENKNVDYDNVLEEVW